MPVQIASRKTKLKKESSHSEENTQLATSSTVEGRNEWLFDLA